MQYRVNNAVIELFQGDITRLQIDAIVNAANSRLAGGGGVDGAIHRAGGPAIMAECKKIGGCPTGEAVITPGGKLSARYVIHTVGPVYRGGASGEPKLLQNAYANSLGLAEKHNLKSIAFPSISTGVYGYPIEEAAKKGKIKIESIHDFTAERVEIEISLPRSVYAKDVIDQLYAFTECEVSLTSQMVVISDGNPKETTVSEALAFYAERLKWCLTRELELELSDIKRSIFEKNLERIFIEEKLYQCIEMVAVFEKVYGVLAEAFEPYHSQLLRPPVKEDFDLLLKIPIRRIAKFDLDKNREECRALEDKEAITLRSLSDIPQYAIQYLEGILKRYGPDFSRKTAIQDLEIVDKREMERKEIEVGVDREHGYIGTKVPGSERLACTNLDRLLVLLSDGTYRVLNITDRVYVAKAGVTIAYCGVADKQQILTCCYRNTNTGLSFCKRFVVKQYILDREYAFIPEGTELLLVSTQASPLLVQLVPKQRQRLSALEVKPEAFPVRGVAAHGIRLSPRPVIAIQQ